MKKRFSIILLCSLLTAFFVVGAFSLSVSAGTLGSDYLFLPVCSDNQTDIISNGLEAITYSSASSVVRKSFTLYFCSFDLPIKFGLYGSLGYIVSTPISSVATGCALLVEDRYFISTGEHVFYYTKTYFDFSSTYLNTLYYINTISGSYHTSLSLNVFNTYTEVLDSMNDGSWVVPSPSEPVFDSSIGSLVNVQYKLITDSNTNETFLDVSFDKTTSTGVDLTDTGYGVFVRYHAYENMVDSEPTFISAPYSYSVLDLVDNVLRFACQFTYDFSDPIVESLGVSGPSGGGHSFTVPDSSIVSYDVVLTPYYSDSTDTLFGWTSCIHNVYFDHIGTRMVQTSSTSDSDTFMDSSQVTTYNFDYSSNDVYNDQTYDFSYTDDSVTNIYNYTTITTARDPSTAISATPNSEVNIYNYVGLGSIPDLDFDSFNISASELISSIKGVLTAMVVGFPVLSGLFDYLPEWATGVALSAVTAVAGILVIRIFLHLRSS